MQLTLWSEVEEMTKKAWSSLQCGHSNEQIELTFMPWLAG